MYEEMVEYWSNNVRVSVELSSSANGWSSIGGGDDPSTIEPLDDSKCQYLLEALQEVNATSRLEGL